MDSSISLLRLYAVLAVFLALAASVFVGQVGAAAAQGAADAAAVAVADLVSPDWDCTQAGLPADAEAIAAEVAVDRISQLAAVLPTALDVRADETCSVIVSLRVETQGWLGARTALGVACRRPAGIAGPVLRAPVAPTC
ncbi:hypothetical protein [Candidatus Poriferisodalis sp.]|uniref:hypothetical protein n=1 Tax=Candidatus Poriferisodalis sp. TaxID=3101277 RepID=UPI003D0F1CED